MGVKKGQRDPNSIFKTEKKKRGKKRKKGKLDIGDGTKPTDDGGLKAATPQL